MTKNIPVKIVENKKLSNNQYLLKIEWKFFSNIKPGNFFMIGINDSSKILKRPIAIFDYDEKQKTLSFVYNIVGKGTDILSKYVSGDVIDVIGPLGNHFEKYKNKKILIVAGGTGIFPMHFFSKINAQDNQIKLILGFRTKSLFNTKKYYSHLNSELVITTDDGSLGIKANPIKILKNTINEFKPDVILTCGPEILMAKTYKIAKELNIETYGSFENRMGCGFGACMGCSIKTKKGMLKVCDNGPIFNMDILEFNHE